MKKIIAFSGRKRSGKSTLSNLLVKKYNAEHLVIADGIKNLSAELLGVSREELNKMKDDSNVVLNIKPTREWAKKIAETTTLSEDEAWEALRNVTIKDVRYLLQFMGTEVIRKYDPDWHIRQVINAIEALPDNTLITIDDVRFPNELKALEEYNADVYFIIRPKHLDISNHASEVALNWWNFDMEHVIINDRSEEELIADFENNVILNEFGTPALSLYLRNEKEGMYAESLAKIGKQAMSRHKTALGQIYNDNKDTWTEYNFGLTVKSSNKLFKSLIPGCVSTEEIFIYNPLLNEIVKLFKND